MTRRILTALIALVLGLAVLAPASAEAQPKPRDPDGTYTGTETPEEANGLDDIIFRFKVKKNGRRITDFTIAMNVVCSGFPVYVEYVVQPMHDMAVNRRNGRFKDVVTGKTDGGTTYRVKVTGVLRGTKVSQGTLSYDVGICQRGDDGDPVRWKAKRTRR